MMILPTTDADLNLPVIISYDDEPDVRTVLHSIDRVWALVDDAPTPHPMMVPVSDIVSIQAVPA